MKKIIALMLVATATFAVGCSHQDTETTQKNAPDTYKIGVIAPLSGPGSTYGQDVIHGYQHVLKNINDAGGVNGKKIELVIEDGKCNGKDATSAAQKLINVDKVELFMGGICSGETTAAGKVAQDNGVVAITPTSSSPEIAFIGDYMFRYRNSNHEAIAMAEHFKKTDVQKIAIVNETTDFAAGFAGAMKDNYDGEIMLQEQFHTDEKDFSIIAKKIINIADDVDSIVLIPQTEATGILFMKALINQGRKDLIASKVSTVVTVLSPTVIETMGADVVGLKGINHTPLEYMAPEFTQLNKALLEGYEVNTSEIIILMAADTLEFVAEAIENVGYEADAIKNYFASFDQNNKRSSRIGEIYFDIYGDMQGVPYSVLEITAEGGFKTVEY